MKNLTAKALKASGLMFIFAIFAADAPAMTLNEALNEGKANNPSLKAALAAYRKAKNDYSSALVDFLPKISASADASRSQSGSNDVSKTYSYGLSGSLSLFSGFSGVNNAKISRIDLDSADVALKQALADTVYYVRKTFIELLTSQKSVALSEEILKRRVANYELVKLKYEAGREDRGSLLRSEAEKMQAENDLSRARRDLKNSRINFLSKLGREDLSEDITAQDELQIPEMPGEPDYQASVSGLLSYKTAENDYRKARKNLSLSRSDLYPSVSASGRVSNSGEQWEGTDRSWSAGVSLSYRFFSGGTDIFDELSAKNRFREQEEVFLARKKELVSEFAGQYAAFATAVESALVSKKFLEAADEQSQITTAKYLNGLVSYYEWHSYENDYISRQRSYLNSLAQALIAEAQWNRVLGIGE
ncbi:MAG: TolC family protein [Endomicrobiales bacterium]|nr:TolC family protein [Endomicrobiales bacterium]